MLVDPFGDEPEWTLGPDFPKEFEGKPFGANIVLMSEPDKDHAFAPGGWLQNAPKTEPNSDPFPGLDLKGTVVYEWNGDLNIAWHYTIDGIRLAHFGDCAHPLTKEQLKEIGHPDIVFMSPPKAERKGLETMKTEMENIKKLKPKIVVWAHHIVPKNLPEEDDSEILRKYFIKYFLDNASTNQFYEGEGDLIQLSWVLENAIELNKEYKGIVMDESSLEITPELLKQGNPLTVLFKSMMATSKYE